MERTRKTTARAASDVHAPLSETEKFWLQPEQAAEGRAEALRLHALRHQILTAAPDIASRTKSRWRRFAPWKRSLVREALTRSTPNSVSVSPAPQQVEPGSASARESEAWLTLVERYRDSLERACSGEPRSASAVSAELTALAAAFGKRGLAPKQVIHLHREALRGDFRGARRVQRAPEYALGVLLEVMANLVDYYRGARGKSTAAQELAVVAAPREIPILAEVSHELRTPLCAILGLSELLEQSDLDAEQRDYIASIRRSGEFLLQELTGMLDIAQAEAGSFTVANEEFTLRKELQNVKRLLALWAQEKKLDFRCAVASGVPDQLRGDATRLCRILINLLGNAIKFTARGSVELRVEHELLEAEYAVLRFCVEDTGGGIPQEKLAKVFDAFSQLAPEAPAFQRGVGLGLAISARLVRMLGGEITATSEPGRGSRFVFSLPFAIAVPHAPEISAAPTQSKIRPRKQVPGTGLRILAVDDAPEVASLYRAYLKGTPHRVQIVGSGEAALELVRQRRYDAICLDLELPGIQGYAVLQRLRASERRRGADPVPIVLVTGKDSPELREHCDSLGCSAFIVKPFRRSDLLNCLEVFSPVSEQRSEDSLAPEILRLTSEYLVHRRSDVEAINVGILGNDFELVCRLGHRMKGTGAAYGFPEISQIGRALECAGAARDDEEAECAVLRLADFLERGVTKQGVTESI